MSQSLFTGIAIGLMILAVFMMILSFAIPCMILYYVYKLEDPSCACTMDWRNPFIKYWTLISLVILAINIAFGTNPILLFITAIMNGISVYALFTYVGDINAKQCKCATDNMPFINDFLYYWRFVMIFSVFLTLVGSLRLISQTHSSDWLSFTKHNSIHTHNSSTSGNSTSNTSTSTKKR